MFGFLRGRKAEAQAPTAPPDEIPAEEQPRQPGDKPDLTQVMPIIKRLESRSVATDELEIPEIDFPISSPLAADLIIMYALDLPTHFQFISARMLADAGMELGALHAQALSNLPLRMPHIEVQGKAPQFMINAGNNFESSLLLHDPLWDKLEDRVSGKLLVAAPARDTLFFSGSGWADGLPFLKRMSVLDLPDRRRPLSECIFERHEGKWLPYYVPKPAQDGPAEPVEN